MLDLHNHTPLCNHATGTPEEYLREAIKHGISIYGFADHAPMSFDPTYRMDFDAMHSYEKELRALKEKYREQITLLIGYEVDYLDGYMDERVLKAKVDYLIGSVHFLDNWGFDNPEFLKEWERRDVDDVYTEYFNKIEQMAQSRFFDIVGHFDLIKVFGHRPHKKIDLFVQNALEAIKQNDMSIEINSAGFRKPVKEPYPSPTLLGLIKEAGIDITFGSDAHSPQQVGFMLKESYTLAKKLGFKEYVYYVDRQKKRVQL